jgi:hypothetical protein
MYGPPGRPRRGSRRQSPNRDDGRSLAARAVAFQDLARFQRSRRAHTLQRSASLHWLLEIRRVVLWRVLVHPDLFAYTQTQPWLVGVTQQLILFSEVFDFVGGADETRLP